MSAANFPGGGRLEYAVETSKEAAPAAKFTGNRLLVALPESNVRAWAGSDEVSIAGQQALAAGDALAILVEKDFACLTPREGEDDSDMFPHPLKDMESC